ncbi:hypothetical protein DCAR_0415925 [Daucus carota subsp. sativus]|uniref:RING-type domain-containing protein n=1 Tax=Daucus carota subsp. sativus TaxID=79200 RepID=A0A162AA00_DAUCS|nr:PREDICTED: uncharacterized protein LOC108216655 [Daucus carota subsp. sativus]WOG96589.1 hypothetical protein DCAR_0415925 [Daucus carota subsp. sativus]
MGKRKKITDHNKTPPPSPSGFMPYSSPMDSFSNEKSSRSVGTSSIKPLSSIMDIMESPVKMASQSNAHHHNRTIVVRHPRHYYGRQYSRRNSTHHTDASSSQGKVTPLHNDRLSFKLARQGNSESSRHAEGRDKASRRLERIRSGTTAMETISADVIQMTCGICQKHLKSRSYIFGNTISSSDLSVVAVLVCGHVYHADCLETKTSYEDRRDPPCPTCTSFFSHIDTPSTKN